MRIVSWNMAYWSNCRQHGDAWRWVFDALQLDILLCQECLPPDWVHEERNVLWAQAYPGSHQEWGTGLVTSLPCTAARLPGLHEWFDAIPSAVPGEEKPARIHRAEQWLVSGNVELPHLGATLVTSVHSPAFPIEKSRLDGVDISAMKLKMDPDLWFTDVIFYFFRKVLGTNIFIGGDFNASRLLDKPSGAGGNNEFFDRIDQEGFVSIHRKFHDADQQTFFKEGRRPHQLDYLYADAPVAERATSCLVHPYAEVSEFSDHAPLVAELELGG